MICLVMVSAAMVSLSRTILFIMACLMPCYGTIATAQDEIPGTQLEAVAWLESFRNDVTRNADGEVVSVVIDYVPGNFAIGDLKLFPKLKSLEISYTGEFQDRHMSGIAELKSLKKIVLNHCDEISATALAVLHYLPELEAVELRGCESVTDLEPLAECPKLIHLELSENEQLNFKQLEKLQRLERLQSINLSRNANLQDEHLECLRKIRTLNRLDISGCESVTDAGLTHLVSLPLRFLTIADCPLITGKTFADFPEEFLETLNAAGCNFDDAGVLQLKRFFRLRELNLARNQRVEGDGLKEIASFQLLENVDLSQTRVADDDLSRFSQLESLVSVDLSGCTKISGDGLKHLRRNSKLEVLKLKGCRRMEEVADFRIIADLVSLKELDLSATRVCRECVVFIKTLPKLEKLDLSGCKWIDDQSLRLLAEMKTLREITLMDVTRLTDNGISNLAASRSLRRLKLGENRQITGVGFYTFPEEYPFEIIELHQLVHLSPDGLRAVARINGIRELRLDGVNLTDSHLNALRGMRNLEVLDLQKVGKINRSALQDLKNSLPKLRN